MLFVLNTFHLPARLLPYSVTGAFPSTLLLNTWENQFVWNAHHQVLVIFIDVYPVPKSIKNFCKFLRPWTSVFIGRYNLWVCFRWSKGDNNAGAPWGWWRVNLRIRLWEFLSIYQNTLNIIKLRKLDNFKKFLRYFSPFWAFRILIIIQGFHF